MKWEPGFPRSQAQVHWRTASGMWLRSTGELGEPPVVSVQLGPAATSGSIWVPGTRWEVLLAGAQCRQTAPREHPLPLRTASLSRDLWGPCMAGTRWPCPRGAGGRGAVQLSVGKAFGTGLFSEESRGGGVPQRKGSSDTALREARAQHCPEKRAGSGLGCRETPASIPKSPAHDDRRIQTFLAEMLWPPPSHGPAWG